MGIEYDTADYARSRIINTCILSAGKVLYIHDMDGDECVVSEPGKPKRFCIDYRELSIDPPTLGYVNVERSCWYVSRIPKRRDWMQGIRHENLIASSVGIPDNTTRNIGYKNICQAIMNKYPKISVCYKGVLSGARYKQAFSRDFCLSQGDSGAVFVDYLGSYQVGVFDGDKFQLDEKYGYLKERLEGYESK